MGTDKEESKETEIESIINNKSPEQNKVTNENIKYDMGGSSGIFREKLLDNQSSIDAKRKK